MSEDRIVFERFLSGSGQIVHRAVVPGGWIYKFEFGNSPTQMVFVPKPEEVVCEKIENMMYNTSALEEDVKRIVTDDVANKIAEDIQFRYADIRGKIRQRLIEEIRNIENKGL